MDKYTNDVEFKVNKEAVKAQLDHAFEKLCAWDYQDLLQELLEDIESRIRIYERRKP